MNYYLTNFTLFWDLKKDPFAWDNMMPFEKQIYLDLMLSRLEEDNKNNNKNSSVPTEQEYLATKGN